MEFLRGFVNQKLIIESNKFQDLKIRNQLDQNITELSNDLFDNFISDLKNLSYDSVEYQERKKDI